MAARSHVVLWLALGMAPASGFAQTLQDPLEPVNRAIFRTNLAAYDHVVVPAAEGYRWATTESQRASVASFFDNLRAPAVAANQLLQGDGEAAAVTAWRFTINSTVGMLGLFDPATKWGYPSQHQEDFGQTLAHYGVPAGPYLVLPLFGPSSVRDAAGRMVDYLGLNTVLDAEAILALQSASTVVDTEPNLEAIDADRLTSLDPYVTARSVYEQRRAIAINNGALGTDEAYNEIFEE